MSKQKQEKPSVTITAMDQVSMNIPGAHSPLYGLGGDTYVQVVTPSMEDLRRFIRAVEDRFGSYTDANLKVSRAGITATETESL